MLHSTEALVMPAPTLFISHADSLWDDQGHLVDETTRANLGNMVTSLVDWIHLVGANRQQ